MAEHVVKGPLARDRVVVDKVLELHALQHTQHTIAELVGISRNIVRYIVERDVDPLTRKQRLRAEQAVFPGFTNDSTSYCPMCGKMVRKPCLVCWLASQEDRPDAQELLAYGDATDSLDLDLYGEEKERYELFRHRKECCGELEVDDRWFKDNEEDFCFE